ncbi:PilZ domain-containing protein [Pseudorhodoplanes sp.]|uniref:PilZ domain-containing protein n=1 Tax=Pseudorhodoplanes sp. TaxID=1934341 RepID=UPI003D0AF559
MRPVNVYHCTEIGDGTPQRPWHLDEISERGARLRVDEPQNVPDHFTLLLKGGVIRIRKCQVIWRSASHVGVKFVHVTHANREESA